MIKKLLKKYIPSETVVTFTFIAVMLIIYSLLRAGFLIFNFSFFENASAGEITISFFRGLKFDLAAIFLINIPVLFLLNFPVNLTKYKWYRAIIFVLFFIINITAIFLNIADYSYFPTIERRLLYEPYTMLPDIIRILPGLISYHYMLFGGFVISAIAFILLFKFIYRKFFSGISFSGSIFTRIISFIFVMFFSILFIRGGFQLKPLRIANAFTSEKINLGYLSLNTTYTVVRSFFQPQLPEISLMTESESRATIEKMLKVDDETMTDINYPFMRLKKPEGEIKKMNVVILIMEGWSASFSGSITGKESRTPFFDSLAAGGVLFTNFYSNGQRSIEGIPSILASLPAIYSTSLIGSISESYKFRGLGQILSENGYTTSFHHGGVTGTMGFDAFSKIAGFSNYYGKESFPNLNDSLTDGSWGVCDEPFFLETVRVLSTSREPFCAAIFSLSSHDPFKIPDYRLSLFDAFKDEQEYERSVRYSDFSLGQFFRSASGKPWFKNTVFLITADHTLFNSRNNFYSTFHTPLLIYSPELIAPKKISLTASHTDILPAILDILNLTTVHSSMGLSAMNNSKKRYAFVKYGAFYGIISENFVLLNDFDKPPRLFDIYTDPYISNDISGREMETTRNLNNILSAYLQETTHAIGENRIYKEHSVK